MDIDEEQLAYFRKISALGDTLTEFVSTNGWAVYKKEVLDVVYDEAFELFKVVDPTKPEQIVIAQQKAKVVEDIESRINSIISQGRGAREQIALLSEGEGE